jgi:large subunit ribosomal protein L4
MAKAPLLNVNSEKVGEIDLNDAVFGIQDINQALFYEVVKAQLASRRAGTHAAKGRAGVSGSKRKMYKQKGTGRARHGDSRAPNFVKGGQAHPPIPRSYAYRPPRSVRTGALCHALSLYLKEGRLTVVDKWEPSEIKTKAVAQALSRLNASGGSAVVVDAGTNEKLRLSARNIENATFLPPEGVNVYDILRHDHLILTQQAARALEERLSA